MRNTLLLVGLAGALAAPPSLANAQPFHSCWGHRVAGTVLGGVGGGAIGAALAAGASVTPWAWAAAGVGALIGHTIGVHACRNHWRQAYYYGHYGGAPPPYNPYYYGHYEGAPPPYDPYATHYPEHAYYPAYYGYRPYHPRHHHHAAHYAYAHSPRG